MAGEELPERLSLIPGKPIDARVLRDAVYRFAESLIAAPGRYRAVASLLGREPLPAPRCSRARRKRSPGLSTP